MQVERGILNETSVDFGIPSGGRVSNAWATCPLDGDNIPKGVLIPNVTAISHEDAVKDGLYL